MLAGCILSYILYRCCAVALSCAAKADLLAPVQKYTHFYAQIDTFLGANPGTQVVITG
jgi:hypothetical protein